MLLQNEKKFTKHLFISAVKYIIILANIGYSICFRAMQTSKSVVSSYATCSAFDNFRK